MPRPLDEEKALRIRRAAANRFGELGYSGTTVKDIADAAGLSAGTVYTYFADKEALFVEAVNLVWDDFFATMHATLSGDQPPAEKLSALTRTGLALLGRLQPLARGMFEHANRLELVHSQLDRLSAELHGFLLASVGRSGDGNGGPSCFSLKVWLSGLLFTLATSPRDSGPAQVAALENGLREAISRYYATGDIT